MSDEAHLLFNGEKIPLEHRLARVVMHRKDENVILKGVGNWLIRNCSCSHNMEVLGGVNSTLRLILCPKSAVVVESINDIDVTLLDEAIHECLVAVQYQPEKWKYLNGNYNISFTEKK